MEGIKGGGKRVGVGEVVVDEGFFDNGTQCINHPHRNNNNNSGGICAFCLQEKLGKLVSSSFPLPMNPSSSSSSSSPPSFRSHTAAATSSSSSSLRPHKNHSNHHEHSNHGSLLPFLLAKKKKPSCSNNPSSSTSDVVFKRSKSTTTPRRTKFLNEDDFSPRKKNKFWSFLYLSASSSKHSASCSSKFEAKSFRNSNGSPRVSALKHKDKNNFGSSLERKSDMVMVVEEDVVVVSPSSHSSSLERKVSRSRSVGCGSRSFSGDFFERISTGLGDCTLRRVESQREGKTKVASASHCMKERVRCGGLFGGFMMMTSSSSSSSASSYWVSSSGDDGVNGDSTLSHGRARSWGWTLASPMRAFSSKASSKDNKRGASGKNQTPNLSAIPSLLTVRS